MTIAIPLSTWICFFRFRWWIYCNNKSYSHVALISTAMAMISFDTWFPVSDFPWENIKQYSWCLMYILCIRLYKYIGKIWKRSYSKFIQTRIRGMVPRGKNSLQLGSISESNQKIWCNGEGTLSESHPNHILKYYHNSQQRNAKQEHPATRHQVYVKYIYIPLYTWFKIIVMLGRHFPPITSNVSTIQVQLDVFRPSSRSDLHLWKTPQGELRDQRLGWITFEKLVHLKKSHWAAGTPHKSNIAPEKWWLEDDPFLLGFGISSGVNSLLNFGRSSPKYPKCCSQGMGPWIVGIYILGGSSQLVSA